MATETVITRRNRQSMQTQKTLPTQITLPTQKTQPTPPTLTTLPTNMERTVQQQSFYSDYNDPYQLNSFADAILNAEGIKRAAEGWGVLSWVGEVPLLRNIGAVVDVAYNTGIKPILKGDWKAAGVNALMNLGETMDIVANPVKGLLMEGGSGFIKGLGVDKDGRVNYDWDTGSWVVDIGLELVSDPLNWISFGGKALIGTGAKAVAKEAMSEVTEKLVKEAAQQLAEQGTKEITEELIQELTERLTNKLTKAARKTLVDIATNTIQDTAVQQASKLAKGELRKTVQEITQELLAERTESLKKIILDEILESVPTEVRVVLKDTDSTLFKTLSKNIDDVLLSLRWDSMAHGINKTLAKVYNISEGFEKFLFKSVITTSGLGLGWKALKPVFNLSGKFINNTILRNLRKANYIDANNVIDLFNWDKAKELYSQSYKMARTINAEEIARTEDVFYRWGSAQFNTDAVELAALYSKNIKDMDVARAALDKYIGLRYKGRTFADYLAELRRINIEENGFFDNQVRALDRLQRLIKSDPGKKLIGQNPRTVNQLISAAALETSEDNYVELLEVLEELYKDSPLEQSARETIAYHTDMSYQRVKQEEFTVQQKVIQHPAVTQTLQDIVSAKEGTVGCIIQNILNDEKSPADLRAFALYLDEVARSVDTFESFIQDILNTTYKFPEGTNLKELQNVIVEKLYSLRQYSAQDVISNPELLGDLLVSEIETALNAIHKTAETGNRIYLDTTTRETLKDQLLRYAYTLQNYNGAQKITYSLDRNFSNTLEEFCKRLENSNDIIDTEQAMAAVWGIRETYIEVAQFNRTAGLFTDTTFTQLKELNAQYVAGHTSIGDLLLKDTQGRNAYSWHEILNTRNMRELFNLVEGEQYNINMLKQATQFTQSFLERLKTVDVSTITPDVLETLNVQANVSLARILGSYQALSHSQKITLPNLAFLDYMDYTQILSLDTPKKIALLQTLQDLASNNKGNIFLQKALRDSTPDSFKKYLYSKRLKKKSTTVFNPANLLTDAENTQFTDEVRQAIRDYDSLTDSVDQITTNIKNHAELKKRVDSTSPLVYTNERYVKTMSNVQNNVFRYAENKMRSLFDDSSAQKYLDFFKEESPEIYEYLTQLYTGRLSDDDYIKLLDLVETYKQEHLDKIALDAMIAQAEATDPILVTTGRQVRDFEEQKTELQVRIDEDLKTLQSLKDQIKTMQQLRTELWQEQRLENTARKERFTTDRTLRNMQIAENKQKKAVAETAVKRYEKLIEEARVERAKYLEILQPYFEEGRAIKRAYRSAYAKGLTQNPDLHARFQNLLKRIQKEDPNWQWAPNRSITEPWAFWNKAADSEKAYRIPKRFYKEYRELVDEWFLTFGAARKQYKIAMKNLYDDGGIFSFFIDKYTKVNELKAYYTDEAYRVNWTPNIRRWAAENKKLKLEMDALFADYRTDLDNLYNLTKEMSDEITGTLQSLYTLTRRTEFKKQRNIDLKKKINAQQKIVRDEFYKRRSQIQGEYIQSIKDIDIKEPFKAQLAFQQQLNNAAEMHRKNILTSFLVLSPEEMQKELAFRGRIVMFAKEDVPSQDLFKQLSEYKKADLERLGIHVVEDEQGFVIVYLDKTQEVYVRNGRYYLNGNPIERSMRTINFDEFKEVDEHLYRQFQNWNTNLTELSGHNPYTSFGDIMDEELYETIYNGFGEERLTDLSTQAAKKNIETPDYYKGLTDQIKNDLPTLEELKQAGLFEQYLFNESILGSADQVRRVQAYTSKNPIKTMKNSMEQVGVHLQAKVEYVEMLTDSVLSIAEGTFKNYTDEQLLELLIRNPRYRLVYLKADKKWGMKVVEIPALNVKAIQEGRRLKAVILPQDVYAKMVNVVNHRLGGSGFFKYWNRIMYLYKFGYLFNPGTIARNWIDTNLKTDMELGTEARGFKRMARDYIRQYKEITHYVAKDNNELITRKGIEEYFAIKHDGITIDYDTYMMLDDFFRNGPVTDIFDELRYSVKDMGDGDIWRTFTHHTGKIMNWANQTEEMNRLAIYLSDLNKGIYKHEAWDHISKVHFDYAFKTPFEQFTEAFLPFSTFAVRNIHYWIDTLMKHPEFVGLFRDIYTPIWNFDDLTPEQLNSSWALQYQIINGNINLFDINDTEYIVRINPSIFDAFNSIVNPIQAVQSKLAAPIQTVFDMVAGEMPTTEDLPVIGTAQQRITKAIKEQNALPSILTKRTQNAPRSTIWRNSNLNRYYGIENTSNPYYVLPKTRSDSRIDPLRTIGTRAFTSRFMTKPKVKVDVYNKVKWKHKQDVYSGIRYQLRLNINKFR